VDGVCHPSEFAFHAEYAAFHDIFSMFELLSFTIQISELMQDLGLERTKRFAARTGDA